MAGVGEPGTGAADAITVPPPRDAALLAVALAAVSTSAPLIAATAAPALAIACWRNLMSAGVLLPVALIRRHAELRRLGRRQWALCLLAGTLLAGHFATWVPSVTLTSVASSTALVSTQPVWAALLARALGRQVRRPVWIGTGVAVVGAALLTGADVSLSARALLGDLLATVGGALAAAYITVGGALRAPPRVDGGQPRADGGQPRVDGGQPRVDGGQPRVDDGQPRVDDGQPRQEMSTTAYTTICYSTCALLLLILCLATGQRLTGYPRVTWLQLAALTAGAQLLGHSLVNVVLRTTSPTVVSLAILVEVPGAIGIAAIWLRQLPPAGTVPGLLVLLAGLALVIRSGARAVPVE
jgi:drug/metabolite transporter (DMT)-like permease